MSGQWSFDYVRIPTWPPLAWLASCPAHGRSITVFAGPDVEVTEEWFGEGVWDGDFGAGRLDTTDLVFGSGARIREQGDVVFVGSGSTLDRLHSHQTPEVLTVSNSLACLLSARRGKLLLSHNYSRQFRSIIDGLKAYERTIPTSIGAVSLTYWNNLSWDGTRSLVESKPDPKRDFSTYDQYRAFLDSTMLGISNNMSDARRERPFSMMSTLSSGYDSPTISVIGKAAGCTEAIGFDQSRSGASDSGAPIADILGFELHRLSTTDWRSVALAEVPFLATGVGGGSSVPFKSAEGLLRNRVLLTGFQGEPMWNATTKDLSENIVRGDNSGGDLMEYRILAGFVNCPIPYWGIRQVSDVNHISNSAEMKPWRVASHYNRPICRRIVEGIGVPRNMFGVKKHAIAQFIMRKEDLLTEESRRSYVAWMQNELPEGRWRLPDGGISPAHLVAWALERVGERYGDLDLDPIGSPSAPGSGS